MKLSIPLILTFDGGFVDTAGFLVLQGLFPAHVTGNFVTIGAALTSGSAGVVTKLLTLPVFGLVVLLTTLLGRTLTERRLPAAQLLLTLKLVLLVLGVLSALAPGVPGLAGSVSAHARDAVTRRLTCQPILPRGWRARRPHDGDGARGSGWRERAGCGGCEGGGDYGVRRSCNRTGRPR